MHHLHPRSRSTSTLFTTTLAISFLVVGLPHILPCPADRRQFADTIEMEDGTIMRRRRRMPLDAEDQSIVKSTIDTTPKRECPIPKPPGFVGQLMGFEGAAKQSPAEVIIQNANRKKDERHFDGPNS